MSDTRHIRHLAKRLGISVAEFATLRLHAFQALRGWGRVRENGQWKEYDSTEMREVADKEAINVLVTIPKNYEKYAEPPEDEREMEAADLGLKLVPMDAPQ